jgi:hypothetical protein
LAIRNSVISFLNGTAEHGESHHSKETLTTSTSIDSKAKQNVISRPPTNPEKNVLASVDLMKNFVDIMDRNGTRLF